MFLSGEEEALYKTPINDVIDILLDLKDEVATLKTDKLELEVELAELKDSITSKLQEMGEMTCQEGENGEA